MDKHPQIVRQQFQALLERANKRFGKLRELQTRGDHSWAAAQALFHKTFDSFSRLWQFQLINRAALLESGLQRNELGGIANKIGQLYYNYYLRSGDTGALLESYTFYDAVHTRQYFAPSVGAAAGAPDPIAAARQMRFYARFVVVCLFLHRREEAMQLLQELQACVSSYLLQYSYASDAAEWQRVVNEVAGLMSADQLARPLPRSPLSTELPYTPPLRCRLADPAAACAPHRPRLQEAIMVSYRPRQVKIAELPLELYRMTQTLEWQQPDSQEQQQQQGQGQRGRQEEEARGANGAGSGLATEALQQPPQPPSASVPVAGSPEPAAREGTGPCSTSTSPSCSTSPTGEALTAEVMPAPPPAAPSSNGAGQPQPPQPPHAASSGRAGPTCPSSVRTPPPPPPRQLLYRPTAQQLLSALLAVTAGVDPAAAGDQFVMLYISADAAAAAPPTLEATEEQRRTAHATDVAAPAAAAAVAAVAPPSPPPLPRRLLLCSPSHHHSHKQPPQPQPAPAQSIGSPHNASGGGSMDPGAEVRAEVGARAREVAGEPLPTPQQHAEGGKGAVNGAIGGVRGGCMDLSAAATAASADGLLSPEELLVGTRRRLLLVLDSDMAADFARLQGAERGFPLLCLAAPPWPWPWQALAPTSTSAGAEQGCRPLSGSGSGAGPGPGLLRTYGSLTSMALSCPAQALCAMVGQPDPQPGALQRLQDVIDEVLLQLGRQMADQLAAAAAAAAAATTSPRCGATTEPPSPPPVAAAPSAADAGAGAGAAAIPGSAACASSSSSSCSAPTFAAWAPVFEDCLTRRLVLHFALYRACVTLHSRHCHCRSTDPAMAPAAFPPLPPAADPSNPLLRLGILRAAEVLGRPGAFCSASHSGE